VDTNILGNAMGRGRIAVAAIALPLPPPSEMIPWIRCSAARRLTRTEAPRVINATHSPRSFRSRIARQSALPSTATSWAEMSGLMVGGCRLPTSISLVSKPCRRIISAMNACSGPLVSNVPRIAMVGIGGRDVELEQIS